MGFFRTKVIILIKLYKYIHFKNIIYSDILCYNILLNKHLNAKLINFTSLLIDGFPLFTLYFV